MITTTSKLKKSYDTVVIGGGLSGLLMANQLQQAGQSTLIVDKNDLPGGHCRLHQSQTERFTHGLKQIPSLSNAESALTFLAGQLNLDLSWQTVERPPVTFEAGFKPYVGFGEDSPEYAEVLNYYTNDIVFKLNSTPNQWVESLIESFTGDYLAENFVTRVRTEGKKICGVVINGTKDVNCENVVYCGAPSDLPALLPADDLSGKVKRALAKSSLWTSISYDILFDQEICDHSAIHLLVGTKDKSQACVGKFHPLDANSQQLSQWLTFIPVDQTENSEIVAGGLKLIQKQLKRAYPQCFEHKAQDRILVGYGSHGHIDLPLTGHQTVPPFENFWLTSSLVQKTPNLLGLIQQVQLVLAAMGFDSTTPEITTLSEPNLETLS